MNKKYILPSVKKPGEVMSDQNIKDAIWFGLTCALFIGHAFTGSIVGDGKETIQRCKERAENFIKEVIK